MINEKLKSNGIRTTDSNGAYITVHFKEKTSKQQLRDFRKILEFSGLSLVLDKRNVGKTISGWLHQSYFLEFARALVSSELSHLLETLHVKHEI